MKSELYRKRVLVTGATGFIGGRLVEKLILEHGADVQILAHNLAHLPRTARFPIKIVQGDLTQPEDVERAVRGCTVVYNCAYGNAGDEEKQRRVNIQGTKSILNASLRAKVTRVVHISTVAVYGDTKNGDLNENAARQYTGSMYADSKLEGEKLTLEFGKERKLPVSVIQPTVVYGPFGRSWTSRVVDQLKTGLVTLVNGGQGLCNAVYVDDVANAILLASVKKEAIGEAFLISGDKPVTWEDFYGAFERMLGFSATVKMSAVEAVAYYKNHQVKLGSLIKEEALRLLCQDDRIRERVLRARELATIAKVGRILLPIRMQELLMERLRNKFKKQQSITPAGGSRAVHVLTPSEVKFFGAKTRVSIDKAKHMLGYRPAFNFEAGMNLTEQWAEWANLLGKESA